MISFQTLPKYDCDVLIIGGGPAGSSLATHLSNQNVKVIVVESKEFPRDKVCGDAVSPIAITELQKLGITKWKEFEITNQIDKATLFFGEEKITQIRLPKGNEPYSSRVIPRKKLDYWIYQKAIKAGARYLENTRLKNYEIANNGISATVTNGKEKQELKAKLIVGADGSNSTVARILNGKKPSNQQQLIALRAYYEGINGPADSCEIFFNEDNFPGLYWVFPSSATSGNIGLGMVAKTLPQNQTHIKVMLERQIKQNKQLSARIGNGKIKGKILGWPLTMYNPKNKIVDDRLLLLGDAAGLINSLSGDGIQYALLSGRWSAETILNCLNKNDFSKTALLPYQKHVEEELSYDFALSNLLVQIARNRSLNPVWMRVLRILIERAKIDKTYASTIGGIFGGTYPSYAALQPKFLLKTLAQAGIHVSTHALVNILQGPQNWIQKGKDTRDFAEQIIQQIKVAPQSNLKWAADVAQNGLTVGQHVIKNLGEKDNS